MVTWNHVPLGGSKVKILNNKMVTLDPSTYDPKSNVVSFTKCKTSKSCVIFLSKRSALACKYVSMVHNEMGVAYEATGSQVEGYVDCHENESEDNDSNRPRYVSTAFVDMAHSTKKRSSYNSEHELNVVSGNLAQKKPFISRVHIEMRKPAHVHHRNGRVTKRTTDNVNKNQTAGTASTASMFTRKVESFNGRKRGTLARPNSPMRPTSTKPNDKISQTIPTTASTETFSSEKYIVMKHSQRSIADLKQVYTGIKVGPPRSAMSDLGAKKPFPESCFGEIKKNSVDNTKNLKVNHQFTSVLEKIECGRDLFSKCISTVFFDPPSESQIVPQKTDVNEIEATAIMEEIPSVQKLRGGNISAVSVDMKRPRDRHFNLHYRPRKVEGVRTDSGKMTVQEDNGKLTNPEKQEYLVKPVEKNNPEEEHARYHKYFAESISTRQQENPKLRKCSGSKSVSVAFLDVDQDAQNLKMTGGWDDIIGHIKLSIALRSQKYLRPDWGWERIMF